MSSAYAVCPYILCVAVLVIEFMCVISKIVSYKLRVSLLSTLVFACF